MIEITSGRDHTAAMRRYARQRVRALRYGLKSLGVRKGDHVAILSENRLEWALSDLAILCASGINPAIPFITPSCEQPMIRAARIAAMAFSRFGDSLKEVPTRSYSSG